MPGTIRTFRPEVCEAVLRRFEEIVTRVSQAMGCQAEAEMKSLTPAVINNPDLGQPVDNRKGAAAGFPVHQLHDLVTWTEDIDCAGLTLDVSLHRRK